MATKALVGQVLPPPSIRPKVSAEYRIEKRRIDATERAIEVQAAVDLIKEVLRNPVIELIGGWAFLAYTRNVAEGGFWEGLAEFLTDTAGATAITGAVTIQQLSPSFVALAQGGGGDALKSLAAMAPLLLKA